MSIRKSGMKVALFQQLLAPNESYHLNKEITCEAWQSFFYEGQKTYHRILDVCNLRKLQFVNKVSQLMSLGLLHDFCVWMTSNTCTLRTTNGLLTRLCDRLTTPLPGLPESLLFFFSLIVLLISYVLWGGLLLRFFFIFIIILQWMGQRFNRETLWWIKGLRVWHPTALVSLHPKFCLARRADSQAFKASLSCVAWSKDEFTMTAVTSVFQKKR